MANPFANISPSQVMNEQGREALVLNLIALVDNYTDEDDGLISDIRGLISFLPSEELKQALYDFVVHYTSGNINSQEIGFTYDDAP